jgi:hypothetical protein
MVGVVGGVCGTGSPYMWVEMEVLLGLLPKVSEFVSFMKAAIARRGRRVVICTRNSGFCN